jgi:hypothetical protein
MGISFIHGMDESAVAVLSLSLSLFLCTSFCSVTADHMVVTVNIKVHRIVD